MENQTTPENQFEEIGKAKDALADHLTDVVERYDEQMDIKEMAIRLSEISDRGSELLKGLDDIDRQVSGPGGADDRVLLDKTDGLRQNLETMLWEDLPRVLYQRLMEERDSKIFGKDAPKFPTEEHAVHYANTHMYQVCLDLLSDPAIDDYLLEPIFEHAFDSATSELDADGEVREWNAISSDLANMEVDKKWITARPKVADRIIRLYIASLIHPNKEDEGFGEPTWRQKLEPYVKDYNLLEVVGSPLKEKYEKEIAGWKRVNKLVE